MNQAKMPVTAETKKYIYAMSKRDKKKLEKIIQHCSWSVDVKALLTKRGKKGERQL